MYRLIMKAGEEVKLAEDIRCFLDNRIVGRIPQFVTLEDGRISMRNHRYYGYAWFRLRPLRDTGALDIVFGADERVYLEPKVYDFYHDQMMPILDFFSERFHLYQRMRTDYPKCPPMQHPSMDDPHRTDHWEMGRLISQRLDLKWH